MSLDRNRARQLLAKGELQSIFIEELGWDRHSSPLEITAAGVPVRLQALAQKRGMVVYHCPPPRGESLPDYPHRRKIEQQVAKSAHEHLIVFTDADNEAQIWQWVKREPDKPIACREHCFHRSQTGEALLQKLEQIAFTLDEEEQLSLTDVTARARDAFDVERVTRRFYDRFRKEREAFRKFIRGIPDSEDCRWYTSVMLNRLMFVYFIQRKEFLDGDRDYLPNRLNQMRAEHGKDKFYSFYRYFLLRLFHEGFGSIQRSDELEKLIGRIPYLNGSLFDVHELERPERYGKSIEIPDKAFENIFNYFDQYQWHLDERPLRADNEINPDVLGYIFEKYINQKQMGAYYTKEDITGYISKNTVLPFVLDATRAKCKVAFENPEGPTVWDLLKDKPDRYIYRSIRHGVTWRYMSAHPNQGEPLDDPCQLPEEIAIGIDPPTLKQFVGEVASVNDIETIRLRKEWNKPAPGTHALSTETWREVIARRKRYQEIKTRLADGEVSSINDLITLNVDIRQFAQDAIENCEGPDLLRAFWHAIERVTVLDPTCGSGAFLFAALNILEPLYDACLDRMEAFVSDLDRSAEKHHPKKFSDFRKVLDNVAAHPNRRYFVFKSIILNNLYGVDIMEEAVEICKLRLFLKLAAQVDPDNTRPNLGIEPLPDIDFNIRSGNTLVGYATYEAVKNAIKSKLDFDNAMEKISNKATDLQQLLDTFRARQVQGDGSVPTGDKQELRHRLKALDDELNRYLASEYKIDPSKRNIYAKWLKSHQPFHWFVEFYGIMSGGGFDVIIGNPPYLESREIDYRLYGYACLDTRAVHAVCVERSASLLRERGCMSMIVPLALPSTQRMKAVQDILEEGRSVWYANFAWRPAKLFDTVNRALTVFAVAPSDDPQTLSTAYQKWTSDDRDGLFERIVFVEVSRDRLAFWVPKIEDQVESVILDKCLLMSTTVAHFTTNRTGHRIYYRTTGGLYWKVFTNFPPAFKLNGKAGHSTRETYFSAAKKRLAHSLITSLSSSTFWWWYTVTSNVRDLNPYDVQNFPVPEKALQDKQLRKIGDSYLQDIDRNSTMLTRQQRQTGKTETQSFKIQKSKPIINEIDRVLALHYGFTEEELDFIINYDIKYRMGHAGKQG